MREKNLIILTGGDVSEAKEGKVLKSVEPEAHLVPEMVPRYRGKLALPKLVSNKK